MQNKLSEARTIEHNDEPMIVLTLRRLGWEALRLEQYSRCVLLINYLESHNVVFFLVFVLPSILLMFYILSKQPIWHLLVKYEVYIEHI